MMPLLFAARAFRTLIIAVLCSASGAGLIHGAAAAANVRIDAGTLVRQIPETLYGTNLQWIWNGNGLWLPDLNAPNPELLKLTANLRVSLLRFPGGSHSDFYHWRDGIGPVAARPYALHEPNSGDRSLPAFGTDEALSFADQVGGSLLITVNVGTGTAQEAADWVRYVK